MHTKSNRDFAMDKASSDTDDARVIAPRDPSQMFDGSLERKRFPSPGVDRNTGQALPISERDWQERVAALERELIEIDRQDDTPEESYERFMRELDEERCRQGRPAAFKGYY